MKNWFFFFFCLFFSLHVMGQVPITREKCKTCGKVISQCQYKGKHPKCPTCGKLKEQCAYKGNHPKANYTNGVLNVKGVSYEMVRVDGGTFTMGATPEQQNPYDDEKPAHEVTLSSFRIGQTEVTQALWKAVMGENPSNFKGDNLPVERVSWNDCQTFIRKLNEITKQNFRLPTEAEWEFAARGGNKSRGYQYSGSNTLDEVAWYASNSSGKIHSVGSKAPNELGLFDMSGNVWEWCQDWKGEYPSTRQTNPKGPDSGTNRVRRGGSCRSDAWYCRSSNRSSITPDNRYNDLGLRLVLPE